MSLSGSSTSDSPRSTQRHLVLYLKGMDSLRSRLERIHQSQVNLLEEEMKECSFFPLKFARVGKCSTMDPPRQFDEAIGRLRKGATQRKEISRLLTPRVCMRPVPAVVRRPRTEPKKESISVEVTKDGPNGEPELVGKFVLYADSDPKQIAAAFAKSNGLTAQQQDRLAQRLQSGMTSAFPPKGLTN